MNYLDHKRISISWGEIMNHPVHGNHDKIKHDHFFKTILIIALDNSNKSGLVKVDTCELDK